MPKNFVKMWSAHNMGAGIAEQVIAYNFSHDPELKSHCGVVEKNALFYFEQGLGTQFYFEEAEMVKAANFGYQRFTNREETLQYLSDSAQAIKLSSYSYESFLQLDLSILSANDLWALYKEKLKVYENPYAIYHACQPQYVQKIEGELKEKLSADYGSEISAKIYSSLTLSDELDSLSEEHLGWLDLAQEILINYPGKKNLSEADLNNEDIKKIKDYSQRFIYLGTVEANNPWNFDYYLKRLNDEVGKDLAREKQEILNRKKILIETKKSLIEQYKIDEEIIGTCENLAKVGLIRLQIRLAWTKAAYVTNLVFGALIEKLNDPKLGADNIFQYRLRELEEAIVNKRYLSDEEIKKRKTVYLFSTEDLINDYGDEVKFYSGEEAKQTKDLLVQKENLKITELKGNTACKGKVKGKVILFTWVEEELAKRMEEMQDGDILVAGQTRPFLMPAIKKAGAIITDEGGITCHAAIVSRELGIPCIIGTKIATQVLKDGDTVEVDADNGVVRITND